MDKLVQGELSFSCSGNFIYQAKISGNDIQGDQLECVFARLHKEDKKILEMKSLLKKDLEVIDDNDYVLLRRKSAKFKPIYCFYGYTAKDALIDGQITCAGHTTIQHNIDNRMYCGFSDNIKMKNVISDPFRFTQVILQPKPFIERVKKAMNKNGFRYTMRRVNYELLKDETFFIEPNENYDELFYKFPKYEYQYEARICIKDIKFTNIFERYNLEISDIPESDYWMMHEELYLKFNMIIDKTN